MFRTCVILHAQIIYGLVSLTYMSVIYSYVYTFRSDDITSVTDRWTPFDYEQNSVGLAREHD